MIEITNKQRTPVQLIVRSTQAPRSFTVLNIPGIGAGKNVKRIADERHTEYIDRAEKNGFITVKKLANNLGKGE